MKALRWAATERAAIGLVLVGLLALGLALAVPDFRPVLAHEQTALVAESGNGRCPSGVENCTETWTHVNSWTHYTASVPPSCTIEIIDQCGIHVTSSSASSSCQSSSNCGHGPHNSIPQPTGPGTWTQWNGHRNINYRWAGQRREAVEHEHGCPPGLVPGFMGICVRACPGGTYVVPGAACPDEGTPPPPPPPPTPPPQDPTPPPPLVPQPEPVFDPEEIDWSNFNPCANGGCLPSCMTDGFAGNCPWEAEPPPETKVCTSAWSETTRQELLSRLRWESIVPYASDFAGHHHPEAPGGQLFLTAASTTVSPARHWTALQPETTLDVLDAPVDGCQWTATAVGVSFRELLPYESSDLAKLRSPGNLAAADAAQQAAALWDRLSLERKQWYQAAFPRTDPSTVWCAPSDLPSWTVPADGVLSLPADWHDRHGRCRWAIPRRGFWKWQLLVRYTSELGDLHTEILADDLSWFREPTGYLGQQVTLW